MDLNPRKLRILRAIVDEYILSGAPVGSKVLSQNPSFKLSSATIRNEMADLEDLGYLEQPSSLRQQHDAAVQPDRGRDQGHVGLLSE